MDTAETKKDNATEDDDSCLLVRYVADEYGDGMWTQDFCFVLNATFSCQFKQTPIQELQVKMGSWSGISDTDAVAKLDCAEPISVEVYQAIRRFRLASGEQDLMVLADKDKDKDKDTTKEKNESIN